MNQKLAQLIETDHDEQSTSLLWARISGDKGVQRVLRDRTRPRINPLVWGAAAACVGLVLGIVVAKFEPPSIEDTARLSRSTQAGAQPGPLATTQKPLLSQTQEISVDLNDGSRVKLAPHSRLQMTESDENRVSLSLEGGRVECDVAKNPNRLFTIQAGAVTVRVIGTRFAVERSHQSKDEKITVFVEEGVVEVNGPDGVFKRLAQGETWSVNVVSAGSEPEDPAADTQPVAESPESFKLVDDQKKEKGRKTQGKNGTKPRVDPAGALFEQARRARRAGQAQTAASHYALFLDSYSTDPRAAVAALELGRLKMDELGDVKGAVAPLSRVANANAGGLGDDALARLVRAYHQLGQSSSCQSARQRYLKTYPQGVHVDQVRAQCPVNE